MPFHPLISFNANLTGVERLSGDTNFCLGLWRSTSALIHLINASSAGFLQDSKVRVASALMRHRSKSVALLSAALGPNLKLSYTTLALILENQVHKSFSKRLRSGRGGVGANLWERKNTYSCSFVRSFSARFTTVRDMLSIDKSLTLGRVPLISSLLCLYDGMRLGFFFRFLFLFTILSGLLTDAGAT